MNLARLRRFSALCAVAVLALPIVACSSDGSSASLSESTDELSSALPPPGEDLSRDIFSTALKLDLQSRRAVAKLRVAPSPRTALSLEVGDLTIESVKLSNRDLNFRVVDVGEPEGPRKGRLDIGVPQLALLREIEITYTFNDHSGFDGWMSGSNLSFLWPYFCSNLFPCHSNTSDGSLFSLDVTGVPDGLTAVYPKTIPFEAPAYMPAITVGDFTYHQVGVTHQGTRVGYYKLPQEEKGPTDADIAEATSKLADMFSYFEDTFGRYAFGKSVASVQAKWGPGSYGGMEHHPFWSVGFDDFANEEVHAHEAAHGWFGNGVRMKCWEDFVLSEGTATYLSVRAITETRGVAAGNAKWAEFDALLARAVEGGDTVAWPGTCNAIDIANDPLWSLIPYMKGAFFLKHVADAIGVQKLDEVLGKFYRKHAGNAVSVKDLLTTIRRESGFDPTPLVDTWLRGLGNPHAKN